MKRSQRRSAEIEDLNCDNVQILRCCMFLLIRCHFKGTVPFSDHGIANSLSVTGSPVNGEASSPPPAINDNRPPGDHLDTVLFQLRQVTRERDELRKRLALASPGTTFDDCRYKASPPLAHARLSFLMPSTHKDSRPVFVPILPLPDQGCQIPNNIVLQDYPYV